MRKIFAVALLVVATAAWGQNYPTRAVRIIVPAGTGGPDIVARVLGAELVCGMAPHPSPANASVGANWPREMNRALAALNIASPIIMTGADTFSPALRQTRL